MCYCVAIVIGVYTEVSGRMSSKRKVRLRQCGHKVKHSDEREAWGHARHLYEKDGARMSVYKCRWCGGYHVGHR